MLGSAAPLLVSEFRTSDVPFVLMLDDLHELQAPACHDVLGMVISAIPSASQVASASRCEQPRLPRLRASGEALEFGAGDLALDAVGAQQVFANADVNLTTAQAAAVTERTEGWPAGLYLASLISKQSQDPACTITGDDRYVADYLYRETLSRQPEDTQRFLRRTAVLDQVCGPLCDAVLGSSGGAGQLRRLEASSLFVIGLDRRRGWYRYHALFREFLLDELGRAEPEAIETLHQRAADWYERNGLRALALEHLLDTDDWDRSVRLACALAIPTYQAGQFPTLQRWYRAIGDANVDRYPPLAVLRCWEAALTGDTASAHRWAALVDAASFDDVPPDGSASFESARAMLRAVMCAQGPEPMMADAAFAVAREPEWSPLRAGVLWLLAEAHLLNGHLGEARSLFADSLTTAYPMGNSGMIALCEVELALLAMDRGDWDEAAGRLGSAYATIDEKRLHDYVLCLPAFAGGARFSVHRGDLNEAHSQLARAMRGRPSATYALPFVAVRLRLQLAKVYLALADVATAWQLLREIEQILIHRPRLGTLVDEVEDFRRALATSAALASAPPLTPAELRLLPYLQTHLTADRIADRLFLSSHTVKTQVKSIYRKLGVSSRNDAIQKAMAVGLLGM